MVNEDAVVAFDFIVEQHFENASFQWLILQNAFNQPHYYNEDIIELKQRINRNLQGLFKSPELAWQLCEDSFDLEDAGEFFTASVLAFKSNENEKIERVVNIACDSPNFLAALCSALRWMDDNTLHYWLKQFFTSKNLHHKVIAVQLCILTGAAEVDEVKRLMSRSDCLAFPPLLTACLRLIGQTKQQVFQPQIEPLLAHQDDSIRFFATWSLCLLGADEGLKALTAYALESGPYQALAIQLVFRKSPVDTARRYIAQLAKNGENRSTLKAAAALGDPQVINWIIEIMQDEQWARASAEVFTEITGIDLEREGLMKEWPEDYESGPSDKPEDDDVNMDEDENLPWPCREKLIKYWHHAKDAFTKRERYFLGKPLEPLHLQQMLNSGSQRQRKSAALHLACGIPEQTLIETAL